MRKHGRLARELGLLETIGLCVGTIIGGTVYAGLGVVVRETGGRAEIAFLIAAAVAALVGYSYAEISSKAPDCGGSYSIVSSTLGGLPGAAAAALQLAAYTIASAFYAHVLAEYVSVATGLSPLPIAVAAIAALTGLLAMGARETGKLTTAMSGGKVLILSALAALAIAVLGVQTPDPSVDISLIRGAGIVFLGFEGFEVVSSASGEMKNPSRDARLAAFISLGIVTAIYVSLALALQSLGVPSHAETTALAYLAERVAGSGGLALVVVGSVLSTISAALASLYVSSRLLYALARDRKAPGALTLTWRRGSPWAACIAAGTLTAAITVVGATKALLEAGSLAFMALFALVSLSGFKRVRHKWVPLLALAGLGVLSASLALSP